MKWAAVMRVLRALRAIWQARSQEPALALRGVLPVMRAPEWTAEHAATWARFLASPTGQALWARLHVVEYLALLTAAQNGDTTALNRAGGYGDARRHWESLSQAASPGQSEVNDNTQPAEGDGLRERYAP